MDLAKEVIGRLKSRSHDVVYWVGRKGNGEENFPDIIFHDHYDAWDGKPAPALASVDFDPPSRELIERLHKAESLILTMMNKHFDWMGVDERRHVYYQMLSYWSGVIKKFKPDAVIFSYIPHTVYDYLLFELASREGIKTVMFHNVAPIAGRMLVYKDFREGSAALRAQFEKNKNGFFSTKDLSANMRKFYEASISAVQDTTPQYLKESYRRFSFLNRMLIKGRAVAASFVSGDFIELALMRVLKSLKENIRDEHARLQVVPDYTKKFVYVPLHYQPECTSSPLGDIFVDQILMLKILSASLPKDWLIYVKEHPTQWFKRGFNFASSRYRGYYEKIAAIKNVRLIPMATSSYDLIRSARATATISGVVGSESVLRQKPVMIFGYPWYRDCPGVFKIEDVKTCRAALQEIEKGFLPDPQAVINFFKAVDNIGISAYIDGYTQRMSGLNLSVSADNLSRVIFEMLENK